MYDIFDKVVHSEKFAHFLSAYKIEIGWYSVDNGNYSVTFTFNDEDIEISSRYSSFHNATIFSMGEEEYVWFIVEHSEDRIYLFDIEYTYHWYPEQYKMWEKHIGNGCVSKPLTENNIRNHMVKMLKKLFVMRMSKKTNIFVNTYYLISVIL